MSIVLDPSGRKVCTHCGHRWISTFSEETCKKCVNRGVKATPTVEAPKKEVAAAPVKEAEAVTEIPRPLKKKTRKKFSD